MPRPLLLALAALSALALPPATASAGSVSSASVVAGPSDDVVRVARGEIRCGAGSDVVMDVGIAPRVLVHGDCERISSVDLTVGGLLRGERTLRIAVHGEFYEEDEKCGAVVSLSHAGKRLGRGFVPLALSGPGGRATAVVRTRPPLPRRFLLSVGLTSCDRAGRPQLDAAIETLRVRVQPRAGAVR